MARSETPNAQRAARLMLEIGAVHFNAETPFIFTSGWASPVYVDCRKIISYPRVRRALMDMAAEMILDEIGAESIDVVAGGETAGIPFAAWLADRLMLPMQYVRKKPKGFGRNARIEGNVVEGVRTLLVEDLATDGGSKLNFATALREAGATVEHCFVVFFYDIFKGSREELAAAGLSLHALTTWWDVLAAARASGGFDAATLDTVEAFLNAPVEWSAAHGGKASFGSA